MKIGIINYPNASTFDIAGLTSTFKMAKELFPKLDFDYAVCSMLPQKSTETGVSFHPDYVGLPLSDFDVLIFPGSDSYTKAKGDVNWLAWIGAAAQETKCYGFNKGTTIVDFLKMKNQWMLDDQNLLNSFLVAIQIMEKMLEPDDLLTIAKKLGLESSWNNFLQSFKIRQAMLSRNTAETKMDVNLELDGTGKSNINTGIPFLDHMLTQISKHGLFNINLKASGDLEIDQHHTIEDCGIILGDAFRQALGDKKGINRMASASVPMDESLAAVTIDFSGRPYFIIHSRWNGENIREIPVSLFEHFLESFAIAARCNLFIQIQAGKDNHHMCEATFKALAKALNQACSLDPRRIGQIPSTKEKIF